MTSSRGHGSSRRTPRKGLSVLAFAAARGLCRVENGSSVAASALLLHTLHRPHAVASAGAPTARRRDSSSRSRAARAARVCGVSFALSCDPNQASASSTAFLNIGRAARIGCPRRCSASSQSKSTQSSASRHSYVASPKYTQKTCVAARCSSFRMFIASVGMTSLSSSGWRAHAGHITSAPLILVGTQQTLPALSARVSSAGSVPALGPPLSLPLTFAVASLRCRRSSSTTALDTLPPSARVKNGSVATCSTLSRSKYPAACSAFTGRSNFRINSPSGMKPRSTGASEQSGRALRPRHVSPFDWSKRSGSAESTLKTVGVWSMFQHASGHPEAAA
mmetsp:Transcript_6356/g.28696  ORF Transcript_6356/g.28696 Transcript_6356/m.28696 type:complete len:335 (-) Transcript_6356:1385-2389(-)